MDSRAGYSTPDEVTPKQEWSSKIISLDLLSTLLLLQPKCTVGFLSSEHALLALYSGFHLLVPKVWAAVSPLVAQPVSVSEVALTQVQEIALGLVELHDTSKKDSHKRLFERNKYAVR